VAFTNRTSNCSLGVPVDFYWYGCTDSRHIEAAINALMHAIDLPGRTWNPYLKASARSEFKRRLITASQGRLKPIEQVKSINDHPSAPLFEIRWQHIRVMEPAAAGDGGHGHDVCVRLLHCEPLNLGVVAIGLHAHEKALIPASHHRIREEQDAEILKAERLYHEGRPTNWGIGNALRRS
jgi:hypothetical protein